MFHIVGERKILHAQPLRNEPQIEFTILEDFGNAFKFPFHLDIKRKMRKTEYLTLKINRRKEKKKFKYEINFQFVEQME